MRVWFAASLLFIATSNAPSKKELDVKGSSTTNHSVSGVKQTGSVAHAHVDLDPHAAVGQLNLKEAQRQPHPTHSANKTESHELHSAQNSTRLEKVIRKVNDQKISQRDAVVHAPGLLNSTKDARQSMADKLAARMAAAEKRGEMEAVVAAKNRRVPVAKSQMRHLPRKLLGSSAASVAVADWNKAHQAVISKQVSHRVPPKVAALPAVHKDVALPWTTTTHSAQLDAGVVKLTAAKADEHLKNANGEIIAKFTASAQASADRAQKHLAEAKAALEKTSANAEVIHETGHKIEKTAGTIKYLYSTPEPSTTVPKPSPEADVKSGTARFVLGSVAVFFTIVLGTWQ